MEIIRAAIVGCGLIGAKRAAAAAPDTKDIRIMVCCDVNPDRARALADRLPGAEASTDWQATVRRPDIDLVFVATVHDMLAPVAAEAAGAGKHVLVEKPGARRKHELAPVREAALRTGALVRVGFNHRYHRAFQKAREIFESGALGEMMFIRGRYGHGGRPGYDKEWRAVPERSGGGELVDQGMHLIDLARWFLGDFTNVKAFLGTYFWDMPVEDNAFLLLRTRRRARWPRCMPPGRSGRTSSRSRSMGARGKSKSPAWAEATASNAWPFTGCCRRWGRPKPPSGNIRKPTIPGTVKSPNFWRTSA